VDQVGEQRDAVGGEKDDRLRDGRSAERAERDSDRPKSPPRALDRGIEEPVGVASVVGVRVMAHEERISSSSRSARFLVRLAHPQHHREQHALALLGEAPGHQHALLGPVLADREEDHVEEQRRQLDLV
jgi:hypothetical protein